MERRSKEPDRKRYFPDALLSEDDAAELPHLTALSPRWDELTGDYDISEQLESIVNGLLAQANTGN